MCAYVWSVCVYRGLWSACVECVICGLGVMCVCELCGGGVVECVYNVWSVCVCTVCVGVVVCCVECMVCSLGGVCV